MRRLVITAALLLAAIAPATASASPTGDAKLVGCQSALDPGARLAAFEGRMRTARGAARLQMRFTLQTSTRDRPHWHATSFAAPAGAAEAAAGAASESSSAAVMTSRRIGGHLTRPPRGSCGAG